MSTTTTRRAALRSSVAAFAAGLAVPVVAAAPAAVQNADAELIAAAADMARHHAWIEGYNALSVEQSEPFLEEFERTHDAWWVAAERIEELRRYLRLHPPVYRRRRRPCGWRSRA